MNVTSHKIFVLSDSIGTSGEQLSRKVMSQFREAKLDLQVISHIRNIEQLEPIVKQVAEVQGTLVNTLMNGELSHALHELAQQYQLYVVDIVTDFLSRLSAVTGIPPEGKPGLYRELHAAYFRRIEAIEFTLGHDDGVNYKGLSKAEVVLTGVSRVGKTPLSMYMAMLGWKVPNVPLAMAVTPPDELFQIERERVIGLTIDPDKLLQHRQHRQQSLGVSGKSDYNNLAKLYDELDYARKIFRRGGFRVLDVTNMPIEASADKIVNWVTRH